jgi:hypothetical protein
MKQIPITAQVMERMRAAFGDEADLSGYAVFEAVALNTRPIRKSFPKVWKGAQHTPSYLHQMREQLARESVPFQVMHDSSELPLGRVFAGTVTPEGQLAVQFAINPAGEGKELIEKINAGTVDQVSIAALAKHVECSECGWDFMGDDADIMNFFTGECGNKKCGAVMGEEGAHAKISGLDSWFELSAVGKGGAEGAFILGPSKSNFDNGAYQRLAASSDPNAMRAKVLIATADVQGDDQVNVQEFTAAIASEAAKTTAAEAKVAAAETRATAAEAQVAQLTADLATANEAVAAAPKKAEFEAAVAALTDIAKRQALALGKKVEDVPTDVAALVESIKTANETLTAIIPVGGRAQTADASQAEPAQSIGAFRTQK